MPRQFWIDLFTGNTWREFLAAGGQVSGFRKKRAKAVHRIRVGDCLLCYLTGVSRFIGALEVTSEAYEDSTPLWGEDSFPSRVRVKALVLLEPETAVPIHNLQDRLSIFRNQENPRAWTGHFRGSPTKWSAPDGEVVLAALRDAAKHPVRRSVDPRKLARAIRTIETKIGPVTIPEAVHELDDGRALPLAAEPDEVTPHVRIQYLLLKLGSEMGFDVWVARNDRSREILEKSFAQHFRLKDTLPVKFDPATTKTIEYIDVLWLKGASIVAAFEVESTTSIYSGLLRMSDLLSMQPNLNIPLYIVGPNDRRDKVLAEVNRPTFSRMSPPLAEICRFIAFSALERKVAEVGACFAT
jgi:hypothetical protein